ncbi:MAG: hypothetical protein ACI8PV_001935 [Dinoroseobacter sp.]
MQDDGRILLGREFDLYNNESRQHIAKVKEDGNLDLGFGESLNLDIIEQEDRFEMQ